MSGSLKGSQADIISRLFRWLPARWFPGPSNTTTRVYATMAGFASTLSRVWQQVVYARQQTRVATSTDGWLDLSGLDFFGTRFSRRDGESDTNYSLRIRREVLRERNTRHAIIQVVRDLTGSDPIIFEPWNVQDTGGWDTPALGWDSAGTWGDTGLMFQVFVNAFRPRFQGIPSAGGWDTSSLGWDRPAGEWADLTQIVAPVTDAEIYAAIASVVPAGCIAWVSLEGAPIKGIAGLDTFRLDVNTLS